MPNRKCSILHLALFTVFLAACASPTPTPIPTPAPIPTATAIPLTPTPTLALTVTPTPSSTPENAPVIRFPAPGLIHDLHWSPDGSQLAIAAGTDIHLYDASLVEQHTFVLGLWTERIAFHPSAPILGAAAKDGSIHFWNTTSGAEICKFTAHSKGANSLALQSNGNLLITTGTDIISRLWDISSVLAGGCDVKAGAFLIGSSYTAPDVSFSADGQAFALVDIKDVYLRESRTRKLIAVLRSDLSIFDIAFSPDGRWLAAAQNAAIVTLWDLSAKPRPTATVLHFPESAAKTYVWRVDFSSDSSLLAGATSDGALLVWGLPDLQPVFSRKLAGAISGLAFKPGARFLTAGALDGSVYMYTIK